MNAAETKSRLWTDLSEEQSEKVVGGVGSGGAGADGAGFYGWFGGPRHSGLGQEKGLINAGFPPPGGLNPNANGDVGVPGDKS